MPHSSATVRKPPGERPRIEVRTYTIGPKGNLEELACVPLSVYGSCPNVGDTILTPGFSRNKPIFYSVQRRYFVQESVVFTGWALILREVDPTGPARKLWNEWNAASKFWDEVAKQEKDEYLQALSDQLIERSQTQMKNDENPKPKPKRAAQQPRPNKP